MITTGTVQQQAQCLWRLFWSRFCLTFLVAVSVFGSVALIFCLIMSYSTGIPMPWDTLRELAAALCQLILVIVPAVVFSMLASIIPMKRLISKGTCSISYCPADENPSGAGSWIDAIRLWWAFSWRFLLGVAVFASCLAGAVFIITVVLVFLNIVPELAQRFMFWTSLSYAVVLIWLPFVVLFALLPFKMILRPIPGKRRVVVS